MMACLSALKRFACDLTPRGNFWWNLDYFWLLLFLQFLSPSRARFLGYVRFQNTSPFKSQFHPPKKYRMTRKKIAINFQRIGLLLPPFG